MTIIEDIYFQDGVPFYVDIEKTYGHVYYVAGGVIVCEDGSIIAPYEGCKLVWERCDGPDAIFDFSDFHEIAEQAKPIDRWRQSLKEANLPDRIETSIGPIVRHPSKHVPIYHLRSHPRHRGVITHPVRTEADKAKVAKTLVGQVRGFHIIDESPDQILCSFNADDLNNVLRVLGADESKQPSPRRKRITENDRRVIKRLSGEGMKQTDIAAKLNLGQGTVSKVLRSTGGRRKRTKARA